MCYTMSFQSPKIDKRFPTEESIDKKLKLAPFSGVRRRNLPKKIRLQSKILETVHLSPICSFVQNLRKFRRLDVIDLMN